MSVESAKAFLEKLAKDPELRKRLEQAPDTEARRQIAKEEGFQFTKDDFKAATGIHPDDALSDADLDAVAGGMSQIGSVGVEAAAEVGTEVVVTAAASAF